MRPRKFRCGHIAVLVISCITHLPLVWPGDVETEYRGRFTPDVQNYEVFVPKKLDGGGVIYSYVVPHFYDVEEIRVRRDTAAKDSSSRPEPAVRFGLAWEGRQLAVELWPSHALAAPALLVERRRRRTLDAASFHPPPAARCHYEGRVLGIRHSRAALSACADGLSGYVFVGGDYFFVEPTEGGGTSENGQRLHLAFRDHGTGHSCNAHGAPHAHAAVDATDQERTRANSRDPNGVRDTGERSYAKGENVQDIYGIGVKGEERNVKHHVDALRRSHGVADSKARFCVKGEPSGTNDVQEVKYTGEGNACHGHDFPAANFTPSRLDSPANAAHAFHAESASRTSQQHKRHSTARSREGATYAKHEVRFKSKIVSNKRSTRSAETETTQPARWVEIAIFCDKSFIEYHANRDMDTYVMTLFNIAANIWHDESIGMVIHLNLVRITYLENEEDERKLNITSDEANSLRSFNKWAKHMNPPGDHANHHDIAVLLTKNSLCKVGNATKPRCRAVGVTTIGQGCNPSKSGCILEDSGLLTGATLAHLIGHLLGCTHDSTAPGNSGCPETLPDGSATVMAPPSGHATTWSNCSRALVERFMKSGHGHCLLNEPKETPYAKKIDDMLPGTMYNADYQCRDMLEIDTRKCPIWEEKLCRELWCAAGSSCVSFRRPAAAGTPCGAGKWCHGGECVERGRRPGAVDGGWGPWGSWSACSRSCGGGAQVQERACDHPKPAKGGYYCLGAHRQYRTCNMQPCSPLAPTYRQKQCSEYDHKPYNGAKYTWREHSAPGKEPCELVCQGNNTEVATLNRCVKNGTPCRKGTRDMCIDCDCHPVDCAWVIDGSAVKDTCGVCNGSGSNCKEVAEFFNQSQSTIGHLLLTVIPAGSYEVDIEEKEPSTNDVAIASTDRSKWYLHGNNTHDTPGEMSFGSVMGVFTTPDKDREVVFIRGPTKEDLAILYSFTGQSPFNPGIWVKYSVHANETRTPKYFWDFVTWTECPVVCGGGTQISHPDCVEKVTGKVKPSLCNETYKPLPTSRKCNPAACKIAWRPGVWSNCTGCVFRMGVQRRHVRCVQQNPNPKEDPIHIEDEKCTLPKPLNMQLCTRGIPCTNGVFGKSSRKFPQQNKYIPKAHPHEKSHKIPEHEHSLNKSTGTSVSQQPQKSFVSSKSASNNLLPKVQTSGVRISKITTPPTEEQNTMSPSHSETGKPDTQYLKKSTHWKKTRKHPGAQNTQMSFKAITSQSPTYKIPLRTSKPSKTTETSRRIKSPRSLEEQKFLNLKRNKGFNKPLHIQTKTNTLNAAKQSALHGVSGSRARLGDPSDLRELQATAPTKSATAKTRGLVVDSFPGNFSDLREAPLVRTSADKELSEDAQRMMAGERADASLDTSHLKVFEGQKAEKRLEELQREIQKQQNETDGFSH